MNSPLISQGTFVVGCNYWASHAGTNMWRDWQAEVVAADLKQLSEHGLQVLRVFPLWPDFQPIRQLYSGGGQAHEIRFDEMHPLPADELGQAGIDPVMMERFAQLADWAQQYHLKLVVGLLTGWMSGRLYVPPALEGHNVLTDPAALMWEVRFVRAFVRQMKHHPAILAWDLGNECNVMGPVEQHEQAYVWTAAITHAIRAQDMTRPVVSGMHSLDEPNEQAAWRIQDQAEILDILTTHPYPYFTPHCDQDPVNTIRNLLHATAQTRWYGDIGRTAAFCEEIGTLGPIVCSQAIAADYLRSVLYSLWAHDCRGLLWWCAYDQSHLSQPPYDWHAYERELGLFRADRSPKPNVAEMTAFRAFIEHLPFEALPARVVDAVCVLTHEQEQWGVAYAAFVLAKQAGLDIEFQYVDQPLKEARCYLLPSVMGGGNLSRRMWLHLLEKVKAGATLLLSHHNCMLSPFNEVFGVDVVTRSRYTAPVTMQFDDSLHLPDLTLDVPFRLQLAAHEATEVLAREPNGNPLLTRAAYGTGQICFLALPIEHVLTNTPGAFHSEQAQPFWQIYRLIMASGYTDRWVKKAHPFLGITEHPHPESHRTIVAINYSPAALVTEVQLAKGCVMRESLHGALPEACAGGQVRLSIPANDAVVFDLLMEGAA